MGESTRSFLWVSCEETDHPWKGQPKTKTILATRWIGDEFHTFCVGQSQKESVFPKKH